MSLTCAWKHSQQPTPAKCRAYDITLICGKERITRTVIAHSTFEATQCGINMLPRIEMPLSIHCKPSARIHP